MNELNINDMENLFTKANVAKIERICSKVSNGRGFNYNDSQDLRSRTTMKLLESKSYDPTRALEPYVWMIASNVANDMIVTGINKYSEIGNVSAVKMESVIQ